MGTGMTELKRRQDWPSRLSKYLDQASKRKFKWGRHDCILHCFNAVKAMTGTDFAKRYRGTYKNRREAYALIHKKFRKSTDYVFTHHLGQPHFNCNLAKRGDAVRVTLEGEKIYGIVDDSGRNLAMLDPERGLVRLPIRNAEKIWTV